MPILGVVASSKLRDLGAYYALQSISVASTNVSTIEFSNIPSTYTHLQVRGYVKSSDTGGFTNGNVLLRFNGDTGSNYSAHYIIGKGSNPVVSGGHANFNFIYTGKRGNANTSNTFGAVIIDILDYANTGKYKTTQTLTGVDDNTAGESMMSSGNWRNTNAITSIQLTQDTGDFVQFTRFSLYGVKA